VERTVSSAIETGAPRLDSETWVQLPLVTSPVVSSSCTTFPFCAVLWLKSNMLSSVPAMLSKDLAADALAR
jgi:hypothetical protein